MSVIPFPTPAAPALVAYAERGYTMLAPAEGERCARCSGSGWVTVDRDGASCIGRCRCQRTADFVSHWNRAGVPATHVAAGATVPASWSPQSLPDGLVLRGLPGRGKSHTAAAALRWLTFSAWLRPMWVEHIDLVGRVRRRAKGQTTRSSVEALGDDAAHVGDYARAGALVIDDARGAAPESLEAQLLEELICRRCDARAITIITTNEPRLGLFGDRLASRLRSWEHVELTGVDRRQNVGGVTLAFKDAR